MSLPIPHYVDKGLTLYEGEARATLSGFRKNSVDSVVTSPPYYKMKDYKHPEQSGQEESWLCYKEGLAGIFEEVMRVLRPHGTCWLNIGDKFENNKLLSATEIPLFLRDECGWIYAQTFVWSKTNATPHGAARRQTQDHEYIFLLAKQTDYDYNRKGVMVPAKWERWGAQTIKKDYRGIKPIDMDSLEQRRKDGKPVRTVWPMPTKPYGGDHMAAFPPELAERCIRLGSKQNSIILDPFIGSGSTAAAAKAAKRRCVGIDLRVDYLQDTLDRWNDT